MSIAASPRSILDHLDKLQPSSGGKYFCPVCGGNDFSVNQKSGAATCYNSGCELSGILDIFEPRTKEQRAAYWQEKSRPKTQKEIDREKDAIATVNAWKLKEKAIELASRLDPPYVSKADLENEIVAWAREYKLDPFVGKTLLGEAIQKLTPVGESAESKKIQPSELHAHLEALLRQGLKVSELSITFLDLAKKAGLSPKEVRSLYQEIEAEQDQEDQEEGLSHELELLLEARNSRLNTSEFLPPMYAKPIAQMARWQCLREESYLVALLTGISASQANATKLILHRAMDFDVTPNLFGAIVAESSQKKSPIVKTMLRSPLKAINADYKAEFDADTESYEAECKNLADDDPRPVRPERKISFFTKTTGEAILRQASRCPAQPLMWLSDELPSIFNGLNQYRQGKGSDAQDLLEYYDGAGGLSLRVAGVQDDVTALNLGIFGGIQPGILEKLLGDGGDPDGKWARFIFVVQPTVASTMPDDNHRIDLQPLLTELYRKVQALPAIEYSLSADAFKYFQQAYNRLEKRRVEDPDQAMRSVWGKTAGRIGKLAINLHVIHELAAGKSIPDPEIPKRIIELATKIAYFAIQQIKSIYQSCGTNKPSSHLLKILEFARAKNDWIKPSEILPSYEAKKNGWKSPDVRSYLMKLVELGYGQIEGADKRMRFLAFKDDPIVELTLSDEPTAAEPDDVSEAIADISTADPEDSSQPEIDTDADELQSWRGVETCDRVEIIPLQESGFVIGFVPDPTKSAEMLISVYLDSGEEFRCTIEQIRVIVSDSSAER